MWYYYVFCRSCNMTSSLIVIAFGDIIHCACANGWSWALMLLCWHGCTDALLIVGMGKVFYRAFQLSTYTLLTISVWGRSWNYQNALTTAPWFPAFRIEKVPAQLLQTLPRLTVLEKQLHSSYLGLSQLFKNNFWNNRCLGLLEYKNYSSLIGLQTSKRSIWSDWYIGLLYRVNLHVFVDERS